MTMAMAAPMGEDPLSEDLNCPICLDLLNEPVTLYNCFHSFCKTCLESAIQGARETYRSPYNCPHCRRRFFPTDASKVNHHLQNIVNSHRKARERIADIRQYEMQEMTSLPRDGGAVAAEPERPSKKELDSLTSFLTAVDGRLQTLLTALDHTSIKTAVKQQAPAETETDSTDDSEETRVQFSQSEQTLHQPNQPSEDIVITPHVAEEHHPECDFKAETLQEFWDQSVTMLRRHFLLIMFIMHACLLVFCFFMAVL